MTSKNVARLACCVVAPLGVTLALFACSGSEPTPPGSDASAPDAMPSEASTFDASAPDANAGTDGCVPNVDSGSLICSAFTLGKGQACDDCAAACVGGTECCHRGALCGDPNYEYRVMGASCIAERCNAVCGVACENWPTKL